MASGQHIYDLTLLLDPAVEAERREQIVADVADLIDRTGEFIGRHDWGARPTAYEVRKKAEADYHLNQFRGANELLEQLDHNLKITDGVMRHRIIKLRPGTPEPPDLRPAAAAAAAAASAAAATAEPTPAPAAPVVPAVPAE
jgi:small subunit ribosomal protein S6